MIRIIRVMEYYYDSIEEFNRDCERWHVPPQGEVRHDKGARRIRSTVMLPDEVPLPSVNEDDSKPTGPYTLDYLQTFLGKYVDMKLGESGMAGYLAAVYREDSRIICALDYGYAMDANQAGFSIEELAPPPNEPGPEDIAAKRRDDEIEKDRLI